MLTIKWIVTRTKYGNCCFTSLLFFPVLALIRKWITILYEQYQQTSYKGESHTRWFHSHSKVWLVGFCYLSKVKTVHIDRSIFLNECDHDQVIIDKTGVQVKVTLNTFRWLSWVVSLLILEMSTSVTLFLEQQFFVIRCECVCYACHPLHPTLSSLFEAIKTNPIP